jgi:small subunit ribosomal protein S5
MKEDIKPMEEIKVPTIAEAQAVVPAPVPAAAPAQKPPFAGAPGRDGMRDSRGSRGPRRPQRQDKERIKPEFDTKIIAIRRVTRVAAGGRRFTFSVAVVSGDRKGRVGVGLGKAGDTSLAIDKATRDAKKNMIKVALSGAMTIPHAVEAKYSSAMVMLMPAKGRGVVAGSAVRNVVELAGIKDICGKLLSGSKNKLNIARATVKALQTISKHSREVLAAGGRTASDTVNK